MLDMNVVENAIAFDEKSKTELMIAMQNITNLDNPNSVVQMKQWLSDNGIEAESLGKKDVAAMIKIPTVMWLLHLNSGSSLQNLL